MATTADIPRLEMLQVADMVAREKGIEREEVLEAMEQAIQKSGRAKYGLEHDIRAEIDRKTGEIKLLRYMQVADPIENENTQVSLVEAQRRNPEAQVGDFLTDELPPIDFGRVAAQTAKQVITQRMRESSRTASARSCRAWSSASTTATSPSTCSAPRA
jgi:transcription termination/antitermination protein NusA